MSVFRLIGGGSARAFTRLAEPMRSFAVPTTPNLRLGARSITALQRPSLGETGRLRTSQLLQPKVSPTFSRSIHSDDQRKVEEAWKQKYLFFVLLGAGFVGHTVNSNARFYNEDRKRENRENNEDRKREIKASNEDSKREYEKFLTEVRMEVESIRKEGTRVAQMEAQKAMKDVAKDFKKGLNDIKKELQELNENKRESEKVKEATWEFEQEFKRKKLAPASQSDRR
jgi:molecular chaperone DnaK (HSP70)